MRAGLGAALMFSVAIVAAAQQPGPQKSGHNNLIRGTGCVKPGVENGCTVLTDRKTGDVYTVFFSSDNLPAPNAAISFEGTAHQGMTTCMQGKAVDVTTWSSVKGRCKGSGASTPAQ